VRRLPEKAVYDRDALNQILDAAVVAHVGIDDAGPVVVPVAFARDGEQVLIHGSAASRLFRRLAAGDPACLTVTILDALVVARAGFELSMNYRCVMVFGRFTEVSGAEAKTAALRTLTETLMPGRWADVRPPDPQELLATTVLTLPLAECSVKVSDKFPDDSPEDRAMNVWAGLVPVQRSLGTPIPDRDLPDGIPVPGYIRAWNA
jgi:nitroimidazol reductase NimA-like FMN-containing flavoprotein (pyridoxamine 5'-phosphate oxidase superfamily)